MRFLLRSALCIALPSATLLACDGGSSNVPVILEADASYDEDSRARAKRDGRSLRWRDHAIYVAVERGLPRARAQSGQMLLPIAEVDAGFNSAQVTFYRWLPRDTKQDGLLKPDRASRWLNIPILLNPDRVLENEQHADYVEKNSDRAHEIHAVIAAGEWALKEAPGGRWHMHTVREGRAHDGRLKTRTRVYAMAASESAPDLEFLFEDADNDETPLLLGKTVVHAPGAWTSEEIKMSLPGPTAITLARALQRGQLATQIVALGSDGTRWGIDSERGEFTLLPTTEDDE